MYVAPCRCSLIRVLLVRLFTGPLQTAAPTHVPTAKPSPAPSRNHSTLLLPCPKDAMILHHNLAGDMVSGDPMVAHACEYMLLIDKVVCSRYLASVYPLSRLYLTSRSSTR